MTTNNAIRVRRFEEDEILNSFYARLDFLMQSCIRQLKNLILNRSRNKIEEMMR